MLSLIRGQYPTLDERIKILASKQLDGGVTSKIYDDDDYALESLMSEQEQSLGKLELDNKIL